MDEGLQALLIILALVYSIFLFAQFFFGLGTAFRLARAHGNNGVSFFGWYLCCFLASFIPGLGIYLWSKYRKLGKSQSAEKDS